MNVKHPASSRRFGSVVVVGVLAFGLGSALMAWAAPAPAPLAEKGAKEVKVKGTFEWKNKKGQKNDLTGTLTPVKEGEWKVVWDFKWGNKPVTYEGVVNGNLINGDVSGTGNEIKGKRTFSFEGQAKDGTWTFQCFETTKGKVPQGNGELTVQK